MPYEIEYLKGDVIGKNGLVYVSDHGYCVYGKYRKRKALFLCHCGNTFVSVIGSVKSGTTSSCGCNKGVKTRGVAKTHGLKYTKEYKIWIRIKERCYYANHPSYMNYGGRGIYMSDEFKTNPKLFVDYIKSLDKYGFYKHSLDRINNDMGYERGNLRWADNTIQVINRRYKKYKSGYIGVCPIDKKWRAYIGCYGKIHYLGRFDTPKEAAIYRNEYIISNKLPNKLNEIHED